MTASTRRMALLDEIPRSVKTVMQGMSHRHKPGPLHDLCIRQSVLRCSGVVSYEEAGKRWTWAVLTSKHPRDVIKASRVAAPVVRRGVVQCSTERSVSRPQLSKGVPLSPYDCPRNRRCVNSAHPRRRRIHSKRTSLQCKLRLDERADVLTSVLGESGWV